MKKLLTFTSALVVGFLLTSCTDFSSYEHSSVGYTPVRAVSHTPMRVGFVRTTYDRWSYDPYRRAYYDCRLNRYYDHRVRRYCEVTPRRYHAPVYPRGYRSGGRLACPTYLPQVNRAYPPRIDRVRHYEYRPRQQVLREQTPRVRLERHRPQRSAPT